LLTRDPAAERCLYEVLRESFAQDTRDGIHLSSLLTPLKEHWRRTSPPVPLTDSEIGYFTAGRGHEDILTRLLVEDFESTPEEVIDGIHLRPDFIAITNRVIPKGSHAELKTRRMNLPKTDAEAQTAFDTYRAQIRGYMALKRQPEMYLIVLSLLEGKTKDPLSTSQPVIAVYKETMTDAELEHTRADLQNRKALLGAGVWSLLPLCPAWQCGGWRKAESTWVYIVKCPYYAKCRPDLKDPKRGMKREQS
jgi:hypothetical protein